MIIKLRYNPKLKNITLPLALPPIALIRVTLCVLLSFMVVLPVTASDVTNIRFKEGMWDGRILRILIEGPRYLDPNLEFSIDTPPLNDSQQTKNELKTLEHYYLQERSTEQIELIKKEASGRFVDMFLDTPIVPNKLGRASRHLLTIADLECQYFVVKYKKRFARPRPSQLYPTLPLVVPNPGHAAYPSGHATQSMLLAKIISLIDPDNATTYETYARDMAKRREIAGVHYPSDSSSGQKLALGLLNLLLKNSDFKLELERAQLYYHQDKK